MRTTGTWAQEPVEIITPPDVDTAAWLTFLEKLGLLIDKGREYRKVVSGAKTFGWVNTLVAWTWPSSGGSWKEAATGTPSDGRTKFVKRVLRTAARRDPDLRAQIETIWRLGGGSAPPIMQFLQTYDWSRARPKPGIFCEGCGCDRPSEGAEEREAPHGMGTYMICRECVVAEPAAIAYEKQRAC